MTALRRWDVFFAGRMFCLVGVLALLLSACSGADASAVEQTIPTDVQPTATATVVWFPATSTPTSVPSIAPQPTLDQRPGLGRSLLQDDFTDIKQWQVLDTNVGSAAYGQRNLAIAISAQGAMLTSLRNEPELDDFYAEMTVRANLCRANDSYGILVRASAPTDGYRFAVSCQGLLRAERLQAGQVTLLQDWTPSGQVAPGALQELRLGVWALRGELRFFVNDFYQFSVRDTLWRSGRMGVFARSAGQNAVSVAFSDLTVCSLNLANIPPTATATLSPTPTLRPTSTAYRTPTRRPSRTPRPTVTPQPTRTRFPTVTPRK